MDAEAVALEDQEASAVAAFSTARSSTLSKRRRTETTAAAPAQPPSTPPVTPNRSSRRKQQDVVSSDSILPSSAADGLGRATLSSSVDEVVLFESTVGVELADKLIANSAAARSSNRRRGGAPSGLPPGEADYYFSPDGTVSRAFQQSSCAWMQATTTGGDSNTDFSHPPPSRSKKGGSKKGVLETTAEIIVDSDDRSATNPFIPPRNILTSLFSWRRASTAKSPVSTRLSASHMTTKRALASAVQDAANAAPWWTVLPDVAAHCAGGKVVFASDDFFAAATNLLNPHPPLWAENDYTEVGKKYDGWETRRRRQPGHDWCVIELGGSSFVEGVEIDTRFFVGNFAPSVSLEAADVPHLSKDIASFLRGLGADSYIDRQKTATIGVGYSAVECDALDDFISKKAEEAKSSWKDIVTFNALAPGDSDKTAKHYFTCLCPDQPITHLRLNLFPDGGVARLRVYGYGAAAAVAPTGGLRETSSRSTVTGPINLTTCLAGAVILAYSDAKFNHPRNLLLPTPPTSMRSGWETARHRCRPPLVGFPVRSNNADLKSVDSTTTESTITDTLRDWVIVKLGGLGGNVSKVEIDTSYFIGNSPDTCSLEGVSYDAMAADMRNMTLMELYGLFNGNAAVIDALPWQPLLPKAPLVADTCNTFTASSLSTTKTSRSPRQKKAGAESVEKSAQHLWNTSTPFALIRFSIFPDGGVARLRLFGTPVPANTSL